MSQMNQDILRDLLPRLQRDYNFKDSGDRFTQGKCPLCSKKELYTFKAAPWVLKCGRMNNCGAEIAVKDEYPDLFDDWGARYKKTDENPNAAADAYLSSARGLKIAPLTGAYSQEYYKDHERNIGSTTIRFPLPGGSWWERLIDQPNRFDRKAKFKPKNRDGSGGYGGHWWAYPNHTIENLAKADEIWIAEGIFDACALVQAGKTAVSAMTVYNYPHISLGEIVKYLAENNITRRPKLIFAFDIGKAGEIETKKQVERAQNEGWVAGAAQPASEEQSKKADWNDLLLANKLKPDDFPHYYWLGELLIAHDAAEKARLLSQKIAGQNFPFTFENRTFWAKIDNKLFDEAKKEGLSDKKAREVALSISEIANCKFRFLYFQRDTTVDETNYYLEITNARGIIVKDRFSGSQIAGGGDFKKRLLSVGAGAQWTGNTPQLERLVARGTENIKTVNTLDFTGYSRDHQVYVLGDLAVQNGRIYKINSEDYFDFGKHALKLRSLDRIINANYDAEKLDTEWQSQFWNAFREKGIVALSFWIMTLFAEQIRAKHSSLPFFEISGEPGSGKSLLIEFLWKLFGRDNYEGFDPTKATAAAIARNLGRVSNLPVVFIEGDRDKEVAHSKKFEWDELKTAYNGRSVRSRGVKNSGNETYEPPFRGGIVIGQNYPVEASPALMERIMAISINKEKWWNHSTKNSADAIGSYDIEKISGSIVHIIRREKEWLETFFEEFPDWENRFHEELYRVRNQRIRKNHAQLHAAIYACFECKNPIFKWLPEQIRAAHELVDNIAKARDKGLQQDHPIVAAFWEQFEYLESIERNVQAEGEFEEFARGGINQSRKPDEFIAINLQDFEAKCRKAGIQIEPLSILKKHLKSSKSRKFIEIKNVNSVSGKTISAWCFSPPKTGKET